MHRAQTSAVPLPREDDDSLLIREFAHRAMNVLAVAGSAVSIARRAVPVGADGRLGAVLDVAAGRVEATGALMRLLSGPAAARVDIGAEIAALVPAVVAATPDVADTALELDLQEIWIDGALARRVTLITAELIGNACRHGLAGRVGSLAVRVRRAGRQLLLEVANDAAPVRAEASTSGTGFGGGIVAGLARSAGGSVVLERGADRTVARLTMPLSPARTLRLAV